MIEVSCPFCGNHQLHPFLSCKDFTVSHETFQLGKCPDCSLIITSPRPAEDKIGQYYQSNDYISHTTTSKSIIEVIYRIARNYTLKWKINLVKKYSHQKPSILDYGCGTGNFLSACHAQGFKINGVEPSLKAKENADPKTRLNITTSLDELGDNRYDIITLWHVLEHLDKPIEVMTRLLERLNDNGTIFIAVPNYKSDDANFYKEYWAGYDVPRHYWHFTQENIQTLANHFSLNLMETKAMKLDSYYVSLLSEKYKSPRKKISALINGFFNGFLSNLKARKTSEYSSLLYILKKR